MGISVWGKLDCYCLLRIVEIKMNPKIGYVACHSASTVFRFHLWHDTSRSLGSWRGRSGPYLSHRFHLLFAYIRKLVRSVNIVFVFAYHIVCSTFLLRLVESVVFCVQIKGYRLGAIGRPLHLQITSS